MAAGGSSLTDRPMRRTTRSATASRARTLGYINTLMIQDILAEPEWADRLGDADRRGLTPLFTVNMTPYGRICRQIMEISCSSRRLEDSSPDLPKKM
jgi:hypothetical protein